MASHKNPKGSRRWVGATEAKEEGKAGRRALDRFLLEEGLDEGRNGDDEEEEEL